MKEFARTLLPTAILAGLCCGAAIAAGSLDGRAMGQQISFRKNRRRQIALGSARRSGGDARGHGPTLFRALANTTRAATLFRWPWKEGLCGLHRTHTSILSSR